MGWGPLSSKQASNKVKRSNWEPRPENRAENHTIPGRAELTAWRARSQMPYANLVDGRFQGTTDEIIQWAAHKWGFRVDALRAVAALESWWDMDVLGDEGDSFGLFQVRRPYHCWDACAIARDSTAFNADYYGGIVRAYHDGKMSWSQQPRGGAGERRPLREWRLLGQRRRLVRRPLAHPARSRLRRRGAAAPVRAPPGLCPTSSRAQPGMGVAY